MINFFFFYHRYLYRLLFGTSGRPFPQTNPFSLLAVIAITCQHVLGVWDLIPILSQLLYRFRCRYCHQTYPFCTAFEIWRGLVLACANGFSSSTSDVTGSAVLAIYDLRFMEYPLVIWCCLHALVLFYPVVISPGAGLFTLAIGAHFFFIGMGAGDFSLTRHLLTDLFFYQDPYSSFRSHPS